MTWTLVYRFYRSLTLAHLERSLYSVSKQSAKPDQMIFFDNNSLFSEDEILRVVGKHFNLADWTFYFARHHDPKKTLSWSNNHAIRLSDNEHFLLARADIIYDFDCFKKFLSCYDPSQLNFVASWVYWMHYYSKADDDTVDHASDLEPLGWRDDVQKLLAHKRHAVETKFSDRDCATFMTSIGAMRACGWYDEALYGWGYDQQDMQRRMMECGVKMKIIPEFLLFHMYHATREGERDLDKAMKIWMRSPRQLKGILAEEKRMREQSEDQACNVVWRALRRSWRYIAGNHA